MRNKKNAKYKKSNTLSARDNAAIEEKYSDDEEVVKD